MVYSLTGAISHFILTIYYQRNRGKNIEVKLQTLYQMINQYVGVVTQNPFWAQKSNIAMPDDNLCCDIHIK